MLKSWMVIAGVAVIVAILANTISSPDDLRWFNRLQRPSWLTFERLIPLIWTVIFVCAGWSAYIVWEANPGTLNTWLLMGLYVLLEVVTMLYTSVMAKLRSLRVGAMIGATGFFVCAFLAVAVFRVSSTAVWLLVPYLLWSPIGTYTTWTMIPLNPQDA